MIRHRRTDIECVDEATPSSLYYPDFCTEAMVASGPRKRRDSPSVPGALARLVDTGGTHYERRGTKVAAACRLEVG